MTSRITGFALLAAMAMGCSSNTDNTTASPSASAQGTPAPAAEAAQQANGQQPGIAAQPGGPGAVAQNPAMSPGALPPGAQPGMAAPGAAPTGEAAKGDQPASDDELKSACKALCVRANACKPAAATSFSEETCFAGCSNVPSGKSAMRSNTDRMKSCSEKTDCNEFNTCMAAGRPASPPPGAGAPPAAPPAR